MAMQVVCETKNAFDAAAAHGLSQTDTQELMELLDAGDYDGIREWGQRFGFTKFERSLERSVCLRRPGNEKKACDFCVVVPSKDVAVLLWF